MGFKMFFIILMGMLVLYKIVEQISYTVCWLRSDSETREKMLVNVNKPNRESEAANGQIEFDFGLKEDN